MDSEELIMKLEELEGFSCKEVIIRTKNSDYQLCPEQVVLENDKIIIDMKTEE